MDLIKLLSNPMQAMMGQELDNVFKRLQGSGQQGQMSPIPNQQMSMNPFISDEQEQAAMMNQPGGQDEWEMLQRQAADEAQYEAEQEAAFRDQWFNENPEVIDAVAPIIEGFSPEEAAGWMDAFYDGMQGMDDEFLETVRAEIGEENQKEWDDIVAAYMEPEVAAENEYVRKYLIEDADEELTIPPNGMSFMPTEQDVIENEEEGLPPDAVSFDKMKAAEQNAVSKQMREESSKAQSLVKAHRTLQQMKKLIKEHPNMADDMAAVFAEPNEDPGFIKQIAQKYFTNKKELAAYQKFTKLSSELVLDAGAALGGKNFTDAKMRLIQRSKPSGRMTDEALNYVIDHMMYDWEPAQAYADAIEKGRVGRYQPRMEMEAYRGKGKKKKQYSEEELAAMNDVELDAAIAEMENG